MPVIKGYGFEVKRKGRRVWYEAGVKVGSKKQPIVVVPIRGR